MDTIKGAFCTPAEVLFSNMLSCSNLTSDEIEDKTTQIMKEQIKKYLSILGSTIDELYSDERLPMVDNYTYLGNVFESFMREMSNQTKEEGIQYSLTRCHYALVQAKSHIDSIRNNGGCRPITIEADKRSLEAFKTICEREDFQAISPRTLQRLIDGTPTKRNRRNNNRYQNHVKHFIIQFVLPQCYTPQGDAFHCALPKYGKEELLLYYIPNNGLRKRCFYPVDEKQFRRRFTNAYKDVEQLTTKSKPDDVGNKLLQLYNLTSDMYKKGIIASYSSQESLEDRQEREYDVYISSHIVNFLRWIHLPNTDNDGFMDYVSILIEHIRNLVLQKVPKLISMEEFKKCKKDAFKQDSLFLWDGNQDLLYNLLDAMHEELPGTSHRSQAGGQS